MRLIIITGDGPEHCYVTNAICATFEVSAIFVTDPPPRRRWQTVLRKHPGRFFDKVALHLFRKLTRDDVCHKAALADVLGDMSKGFSHTSLVSRVGRPRNGQLENAVRKQDPDILAIYGTGLIPETVLRYARTLAINMHTGLSPYYRGTACAFWPLHENEPEKLGATVHECTSEIDGGQIFSCARSGLIAGDTLHHAFARAVVAGTEIYLNVLRKAQNDAVLGIPQDLRMGREYHGIDRGLVAELVARRNLARIVGS